MEEQIPHLDAPPAPLERPFPHDPVTEAYKARMDRAELRANLLLTPQERMRKAISAAKASGVSRPETTHRASEVSPRWVAPEDDAVPRPFPYDPVVAIYKGDVDRTLLRANLRLTPQRRVENMMRAMRLARALRQAGARARAKRAA